ncbi:MAG TPA: hypothetical protein DEV93_12435 [Chloroflexi bacterium]|jgi:hypothetical protein|nr:hypothetical protein [Chloroflexota bacterium]
MKALAILAAGIFVLAGATMSSAAGQQPVTKQAASRHSNFSVLVPAYGGVAAHRLFVPLQANAAAADTPVVTDTPQPTVTATANSYPDAPNLFNAMVNKLALIKTLKFKEITNGQQPGIDTLQVITTGSATCTGPALYGHVAAVDTVEGTSQKTTLKYSVIQFNGNYFERASETHNKWAKMKTAKANQLFAPDTGALLICSTAGTGSSGGSGSSGGTGTQCQIKNMVDLGPGTIAGTDTWNVQADYFCASGTTTSDETLGFQIAQHSYLLLEESISVDDTVNNIQLQFQRYRTNFGVKVTIHKPKIGSKLPK